MIAFEFRLARAALRNVLRNGGRRMLWIVVLAVASAAAVVDLATAGSVERDLGGLRITPLIAVCCLGGIFAIAAVAGAATARPYGTRAADAIWWRYAGVTRERAMRITAIILIGRVPLTFGAVTLAIAAAFTLADPEAGSAIIIGALVAIITATTARAIALACTVDRDGGADRRLPSAAATADRPQPSIPAGLGAARWLIAVNRGERVLPFASIVYGFVFGVVLAYGAARVNGQLVSLVAVIGPSAVLLGSALRRDTAIEALQSPWWRLALGLRPCAVAGWAISTALGSTFLAVGIVAGLSVAFGVPLIGVLALPTVALIALVQKLLCLAVDVGFPDRLDRRGPASLARVTMVAIVAASIVTLAWSVAIFGVVAMLAVADLALASAALLALRWISPRLAR